MNSNEEQIKKQKIPFIRQGTTPQLNLELKDFNIEEYGYENIIITFSQHNNVIFNKILKDLTITTNVDEKNITNSYLSFWLTEVESFSLSVKYDCEVQITIINGNKIEKTNIIIFKIFRSLLEEK